MTGKLILNVGELGPVEIERIFSVIMVCSGLVSYNIYELPVF
jgi:hypothetical protein